MPAGSTHVAVFPPDGSGMPVPPVVAEAFPFADVLEAAPDGVVVVQHSGTIVYANARMHEIFGYDPGTLHGRSVEDLVPLGLAARHRELREAYMAHPTARTMGGGRLRGRRRDGTEVPVDVSLGPGTPDGEHFTAIVRDEATRVAAEERDELRHLRELDDLRTKFINSAAHELRTPLTPIRLQLHILKTDHAPFLAPQVRRSIEILDRNVDRLNHLVQDVLDGARLQAGRFPVNRRPIDLSEVLAEAIESFDAPARQAGVALAGHVAGPLPAAVDEVRIMQVFYNLLSNAVKFTPGGGRVDVEASRAGSEIVVRVSDTGVGLTRGQADRLFQPFSRVHDTMSFNAPGTGLGLYVASGILSLHDGSITVESAGPDLGSTFEVRLPSTGQPLQPSQHHLGLGGYGGAAPDSLAHRVRELI